jgi:IS30 family transposase
MKRSFKHLSLLEREKLYGGIKEGRSLRDIARDLGRDHTSLSREIKNNTKYGKSYLPCLAHKRALRVGNRQRYHAPLKSPEVFLYVRQHLRSPYFWTPEMIAGRINLDIKGVSVCVETVYGYIYSRTARRDKLWEYLPSGRKKRRRRKSGRKVQNEGKVPNALSIDLRPKSIERRQVPGHWETDNVEGVRTSKPTLSVSQERMMRFTFMTRVVNQTAKVKTQALARRFKPLPEELRLSITQDNGKENYGHEETKRELGTEMYFCHAYHSWEKGGVENRNRVIRRFFPKGTDFTDVSDEEVAKVEYIVNSMPMKCLGFATPHEKMDQLMLKLSSAKST